MAEIDEDIRRTQEAWARRWGLPPPPPRKLRIVSDGDGSRTVVFDQQGQIMDNVARVIIHPIEPGKPVRATLVVTDVELNVTAQACESHPNETQEAQEDEHRLV